MQVRKILFLFMTVVAFATPSGLLCAETEQDHINAIKARPDDDQPRRDFAEWLRKNGSPERAEFIELQLADDPKNMARQAKLIDEFTEQLTGGLVTKFVRRKIGRDLSLAKSNIEFWEGNPVLSGESETNYGVLMWFDRGLLVIEPRTPDGCASAVKILGHPKSVAIWKLWITPNYFESKDLEPLLASKNIETIASLRTQAHEIQLRAILKSKRLSKLTELKLEIIPLSLSMGSSYLTEKEGDLLVEVINFDQLRRLKSFDLNGIAWRQMEQKKFTNALLNSTALANVEESPFYPISDVWANRSSRANDCVPVAGTTKAAKKNPPKPVN